MVDSRGPVATRFGRNLRAVREREGFSQEDLGWHAALHRTEIGLLERGTRVPRIDTLIKLCTALSVSFEELLEGIGFELMPEANPRKPPGVFVLTGEADG